MEKKIICKHSCKKCGIRGLVKATPEKHLKYTLVGYVCKTCQTLYKQGENYGNKTLY